MLSEGMHKYLKNKNRYYLRFHNAISRAIELNKLIFNDKLGKDGKQPAFEHSLRVAGYCSEIQDQTMLQYHQCFLLGILHDNKQQNQGLFNQKITEVLQDLLENEQADIIKYIDVLTSDINCSKGQQKRDQIIKAQKMELIPSWIMLFDKLDNCKRFKKNSCQKSKEELDGYYSVAYLIYLTLTRRHNQIQKYLTSEIHDFYKLMGEKLGGEAAAKKCAQNYFKIKG